MVKGEHRRWVLRGLWILFVRAMSLREMVVVVVATVLP